MTGPLRYAIVVPTVGRPSLARLLRSLAASAGPEPDRVVVVDDRPGDDLPALPIGRLPGRLQRRLSVVATGGRGPAAARNAGWRSTDAPWVVFLDDDVEVGPSWRTQIVTDLRGLGADVAGSQARLRVPLPAHRRPTDWERGTAGLAGARWITADMAYRRDVLARLGGFDERFPRAYREDADLALRAIAAGHRLVRGGRSTLHPVRPAPWWASIAQQRGNADDALMRALHGRSWPRLAGAAVGRRPAHLVATAAGAVSLAALAARRPRLATAAGLVWAGITADFARARIVPGPWEAGELARMAATSVAIPPVATYHWLRGLARHRGARPWAERPPERVDAVLVDRDGTIVRDVPYNGDPDRVEPMPGAREALDRLRAAGVPVAVVTNQSGVARGLLTEQQVRDVNARVEVELGPFTDWQVCPHADGDGCACRKPEPGMVRAAATALGVDVRHCLVVGDTGADVEAALAAGAQAVLVPDPVTRADEVKSAPWVAVSLDEVVNTVLARRAAEPLSQKEKVRA